jgi:hypothetical protein
MTYSKEESYQRLMKHPHLFPSYNFTDKEMGLAMDHAKMAPTPECKMEFAVLGFLIDVNYFRVMKYGKKCSILMAREIKLSFLQKLFNR